MIAIIPANKDWLLCTIMNGALEYHPIIAWCVFETSLPPIPMLAWGNWLPDPYALRNPEGDFYVRGEGTSWRLVYDRAQVLAMLRALSAK